MKTLTTSDGQRYRLTEIEAHSYQIAMGDSREPRAYAIVLVETDPSGETVETAAGQVRLFSTASWRKAGRIRTSIKGYPAEWRGVLATTRGGSAREDVAERTRAGAVEQILRLFVDQRAAARKHAQKGQDRG